MAEENNIYSAKDTLDINELASLNDDISLEFIEQLQNQVTKDASKFTGKPITFGTTDAELFEEPSQNETTDNQEVLKVEPSVQDEVVIKQEDIQSITSTPPKEPDEFPLNNEIEGLTNGNIIEKPLTKEQIDYNQSLDYLDGDKKYSKYVIYIDSENTEFKESLTVKERKNLINRILREQDDIALTRRRLGLVQTVIKHSIIAIITISLAIPAVYFTINASLEASINNYRRSQTIFKTLYKEKGKIKSPKAY